MKTYLCKQGECCAYDDFSSKRCCFYCKEKDSCDGVCTKISVGEDHLTGCDDFIESDEDYEEEE